MTPKDDYPTTELGYVNRNGFDKLGELITWANVLDERETTRELAFPESVTTYRRMRSTDAHVSAILAAIIMPIRRFGWSLDPNGASDKAVDLVSRSLGLPILGSDETTKRRTRGRFSHDRHLADVLRGKLTYGWQMHEQVAEIVGREIHLRKLPARPQHTISEIRVATDGGLMGIKQGYGVDAPVVDVNRLVAYTWNGEPGEWQGESLLRPMYRPWKIKDRILRVGAINIERAGGIPWVEAAQGANTKELKRALEFAQQFRVGETAGGALPFGWQLKFAQAAGGNEAVEYVKLQNQEMSRAALAMFLDLGTTETGARALGEGFIDFFSLQLDTIAGNYADTFNEHVIEDLIDWNFTIDENAPRLVYDRDPDPKLAITDLTALVNAGLIVVDDVLEDSIRAHYRNLTPADREKIDAGASTSAPDATPDSAPGDAPSEAIYASKDPDGRVKLPGRKLRRLPNETEIMAALDLEAIDAAWTDTLDALLDEWKAIRQQQIDDIVEQIEDAGSIAALAAIGIETRGVRELTDAMLVLVAEGVEQAIAEAEEQGVALSEPEVDAITDEVEERAAVIAAMLADELRNAGIRKAQSIASGDFNADEVADGAREHLEDLKDGWLKTQLGGALTNAMNSGRAAAMETGEDAATKYVSTALLDANTCGPCRKNDAKEYPTLAAALKDYPIGPYKHCEGGIKCRCFVYGVYAEEINIGDEQIAASARSKTKATTRKVRKYVRNNAGQFGTKDIRIKGMQDRVSKNRTRRDGAAGPSKLTTDEKIANYRKMHGKDPSPKIVEQMRAADARREKEAKPKIKGVHRGDQPVDKFIEDRIDAHKKMAFDDDLKKDTRQYHQGALGSAMNALAILKEEGPAALKKHLAEQLRSIEKTMDRDRKERPGGPHWFTRGSEGETRVMLAELADVDTKAPDEPERIEVPEPPEDTGPIREIEVGAGAVKVLRNSLAVVKRRIKKIEETNPPEVTDEGGEGTTSAPKAPEAPKEPKAPAKPRKPLTDEQRARRNELARKRRQRDRLELILERGNGDSTVGVRSAYDVALVAHHMNLVGVRNDDRAMQQRARDIAFEHGLPAPNTKEIDLGDVSPRRPADKLEPIDAPPKKPKLKVVPSNRAKSKGPGMSFTVSPKGKGHEGIPTMERAMDVIGAVHDPDVILKYRGTAAAGHRGTHWRPHFTPIDSPEGEIGLKPTAGVFTAIHEIGHAIDFQMFGTREVNYEGSKYAKADMGTMPFETKAGKRRKRTPKDHALTEWYEAALAGGEPDKRWGTLYANSFSSGRGSYLSYLQEPSEMLARSYEQYIAVRSGDPDLLAEFNEARRKPDTAKRYVGPTKDNPFASYEEVTVEYGAYWSDEEFEPIAAAFDKLFADTKGG